MTVTVNSRQKDLEFSRNTAFLQQRKTSSKLRVPFIPDADVGADDFSAQRCRRFCHMQGLIAVEGHGQVCMSGPLGDFAGVVLSDVLQNSLLQGVSQHGNLFFVVPIMGGLFKFFVCHICTHLLEILGGVSFQFG